ncbi:MAG: CHAT domain-containing protein [Acidobacteriia bacterium]|nr:CHAT domain-containing protein [Terriglobia bacterium]
MCCAWRIAPLILLSLTGFAQNGREEAEKLMASARALASEKNPDLLHKSGADFERAAGLWKEVGDTGKQIEALYGAAWTHYPLREFSAMSALLDSAVDLTSGGNFAAARAELLASRAVVHNELGEYQRAINEYGAAREIQQMMGNTQAVTQLTDFQANSWRMLGNAAEKSQDLSGAVEAHRQAAALFEQAGDAKRAGQEYLHVGQLTEGVGNAATWEQSAAFFTSSIPLLEAAADRAGLASAWWGLGSVTDSMNQPERSRDAFLKALPYLPDLHNQKAEGMVLRSLADQYVKLGNVPEAAGYFERAIPLFEATQDVLNLYVTRMKLGKAYEALSEPAKALAAYRAAAAASHNAGDKTAEATAQTTIGQLHLAARQWEPALEAFTASQKIHEELGDKAGESLDWQIIGAVYAGRGQYQETLRAAQKSLALLNSAGGSRKASTQALIDIGDSYNALHLSGPAIENLEKARDLADNDTQMATALVELGEVYYGLTRLDRALELENRALELALKLDAPAFVSRIRNSIGLTRQAGGEVTEARKIFEQGLADARQRRDVQQTYTSLHNLARLEQDLGNNRASVKLFEEALQLAENDRMETASTLDALGTGYHLLGEDEKAIATLERSRAEWRDLGNQNGESISLNNLALVYADIGRPQQALDAMNNALSKRRGLGDDAGVAELLRGVGGIYQALGDFDRAAAYFTQVLETQKRFGDEHGQALTYNSLGVVEMNQQRAGDALAHFEQAMPLLEKFGDRRGQVTVLSNIANARLNTKNLSEAEAQFNTSLGIAREIADLNGQALALHGLGSVYQDSDRLDRALETYRESVALWRQLRNPVAESKAHSLIAKVEREQGKIEAALKEAEESIRLLEVQRGELASEDLRAYFLAATEAPYNVQVELLMDMHHAHPGQGWDARAFEASEQARARSLLDLIAQSHLDLHQGVDPALLARDRAAREALAAKAVELQKVKPEGDDFKQLQVDVAELTAERERVEAAMRAANPRYRELSAPRPLNLRTIQSQVLDSGTLLLEYFLGEKRSYLFAVTSGALRTYEMPRREDVSNALADLAAELQSFSLDRTLLHRRAQELSAMLLRPAASLLQKNRLLIVGDGDLAQIPFSALPNPTTGEPLIVTNEILTEPSASLLPALREKDAARKKASRELAVIADPVFQPTDARMGAGVSGALRDGRTPEVLAAAVHNTTRGGKTLERLEHSEAEARAILAMTPPDRSVALLGFRASKANVADARLADYRMVHFATHGMIDRTHPQLSGLALSLFDEKGQPQDGFLDLNAIFDMKLAADLVVLSACESGEGKAVGGEGLMGLTRGFFYAGAKSLAVSLWSVDDEATAELMKRFYQGMLGARLSPAAALRAAQRSMILDAHWSDPYYWAAFTLEGEWRKL